MRVALPLLLCALTTATATPAATQDWPQYHGGATHDNSRKGKLAVDNPRFAWHVEDAFGQPTLAGTDLYSGGKALFRIDPTTGEVLASVGASEDGVEPAIFYGGAPALTETLVIARKGTGVEAWDRALAEVVWSWEPVGGAKPGYGFPGLLVEGYFVFTYGSDVVALSATDGNLAWTYSFGSDISMVPAAHEGRIFVGTRGGDFLALSLTDGQELWRFEGEAEFGHTSPVITGGLVVIGDRGVRGGRRGAINAFDVNTGEQKWETVFGATGFSTPGVAKGVVLGGFGRTVGFFSLKDGEREKKPRISCGTNAFGSPTVIGSHLVYGNLDGNLYVHDAKKGKLLWQFRLPEGQVNDFVHARERLFVSTTKGLFALEDAKGKAKKGNVLTWTGKVD